MFSSSPTVSATRASFLSESSQASKFAFLQLCLRWCKETARCSLGMVIWKWTSLGTAQCPQSCSCHPQVLRCFRTALQTSAELRWKLRVRLLSGTLYLYQRASALMYLVTTTNIRSEPWPKSSICLRWGEDLLWALLWESLLEGFLMPKTANLKFCRCWSCAALRSWVLVTSCPQAAVLVSRLMASWLLSVWGMGSVAIFRATVFPFSTRASLLGCCSGLAPK